MQHVHLQGMNVCLAPPSTMPDGTVCSPLMAYETDAGFLSAWRLSDDDLDNILATGTILLQVVGAHPPVCLLTHKSLPPEVKA